MAKLFFLFDIWLMSLSVPVKVGNITSLSEARYCAGMGVDFLGFRLGKGGLTPQAYQEIINWVSVPHLVLEAHHDLTVTLEEITTHYPGHYIEINKDQLTWLSAPHQIILCTKASEWPTIARKVKDIKNIAFVEMELDTPEVPPTDYPLILRVSSNDQLEKILRASPTVISLDGSPESRPGLMDYGFVGEVLESLTEQ